MPCVLTEIINKMTIYFFWFHKLHLYKTVMFGRKKHNWLNCQFLTLLKSLVVWNEQESVVILYNLREIKFVSLKSILLSNALNTYCQFQLYASYKSYCSLKKSKRTIFYWVFWGKFFGRFFNCSSYSIWTFNKITIAN